MRVLPLNRLRAGQAALTATVVAALSLAPVTAAEAQTACLAVDSDTTIWLTGEDRGGFVKNFTITNICDDGPVYSWTLQFTLPPGHTFEQGWSAEWTRDGNQVRATGLPWGSSLASGGSVSIGFVGGFTGAYQDPTDCTINGAPCDGAPANDEPPTVALTEPTSGTAGYVPPCPFVLAAEATDPDGIDRVEFYVNDRLVGTDDTFPYQAKISGSGLPPNSVAFARAYDRGTPQLSSDSEPVTFSVIIGDPVPNIIFACGGQLQLPAGTSEEVRFVVSSYSSETVTLTVTGDPGVTVSPTTAVSSGRAIDVTVTADPDSAGATATITATSGTMRPGTLSVTVLPSTP